MYLTKDNYHKIVSRIEHIKALSAKTRFEIESQLLYNGDVQKINILCYELENILYNIRRGK